MASASPDAPNPGQAMAPASPASTATPTQTASDLTSRPPSAPLANGVPTLPSNNTNVGGPSLAAHNISPSPAPVASALAQVASSSTPAATTTAESQPTQGAAGPKPAQTPSTTQVSTPQPNDGEPPAGPNASTVKGLQASIEYAALLKLIEESDPSVVRQCVRDSWAKCLMGSDYHVAFLTNTCLHQGSPSLLNQAVEDFGQKLVGASKHHLVKHLSTQHLDDEADVILAKASSSFLDKALARRLETIPARTLVNALARAERLGYDVQDVVDDRAATGTESVFPTMQHAPPPHAFTPPPSAYNQPLPIHQVHHYQPHQPQHTPTPPPPQHQQMQYRQYQQYPNQPRRSTGLNGQSNSPASTASPGPIGSPGPMGIMHCRECGRPCSGRKALRYHSMKDACAYTSNVSRIGKDICVHCGCFFGSSGGLPYHVKSKVCGEYSREVEAAVYAGVVALPDPSVKNSARNPPLPSPAPPVKSPAVKTPTVKTPAPSRPPFSSWTTESGNDPYSKLTPGERANFESDMSKAEEHYGNLMREAMKLPEPKREEELGKLKNSYNTKQSTTRKKYGIRLRERRTRAEIDAERDRLFGSPAPHSDAHVSKKAKTGGEGQSTTTASSQPTGSQAPDTPRKRVPLSEMGGLSGSSATAELVDPTAPPSATQGTVDDPMQIDDSSGSDSDGSGDDIPARVPDAVT